ncbi:MAG: NUDIX hydrolase [Desulfarculaceae bacterium]|nr:NUDIX hydrolase [Desulfarculaceae bacterium]
MQVRRDLLIRRKGSAMAAQTPRNPFPTVDIIIETEGGIVLIKRKNPPFGWAIPGGFVDYGESLEQAAKREAKEETRLDVHLVEQFHAYSEPGRDPRFHTVSMVFIATASGKPEAADDAGEACVFSAVELPETLAFDHGRILADYLAYKSGRTRKEISSRL